MITCNPGGEEMRLKALERYDLLDTEPEQSFDRITRLARTVLQMPFAMVSLVDRDRVWFKSRQNVPAPQGPRVGSFCENTIQQVEPFIVTDASTDPRFADNPIVKDAPGIRCYVGVPLRTRDGYNLGSLCTLDTKQRTLSAEQIELLKDLARLVVDEIELRHVAATDSLTGAMTRRCFMEEARRDFADARRLRKATSCIVLDLDRFKLINDKYGHGVGDLVLQHAATVCKNALPNHAYLGRLGGEEFAIMLPLLMAIDARIIAESLRAALAASKIQIAAEKFGVTASFGVAELRPQHGTAEELLHDSDKAMYAAKLAGGNRVEVYRQITELEDVLAGPQRLSA